MKNLKIKDQLGSEVRASIGQYGGVTILATDSNLISLSYKMSLELANFIKDNAKDPLDTFEK